MRQIVLDTETTGLSPAEGHRIIEVAAIELVDRRLTGRHFHHYINPERQVDAGAVAVHGLTLEFLADKPLFSAIAAGLIEFIKGAELVIHNAPFDVGFLNHELKMLDNQFEGITHYCTILDTLPLARKKHPGQQNSLDALCKRYSIDHSGRQLHGALLDSHLLAGVYLAMTGGQTSLFSESHLEPLPQNTLSFVQERTQTFSLKVITANSEEVTAHRALLENIKKAAGGVSLWEEE